MECKSQQISYQHGGDVWTGVEVYGHQMEQILDLSANINFLGLSPLVREAVLRGVDQIVHYPDHRCRQLISALSKYLEVEPEAICAGNGAVDLLDHWLRHVRAKKVLICDPAFGQYYRAVSAHGGEAVRFILDERVAFRPDVEEWQKTAFAEGCDTAILCSPHNPAGWTWSKDEKNAVVSTAQKYNMNLLVDESFLDFVPDGRKISCCAQASRDSRLAVLYSLTKFFAIPGIRLGALITEPKSIHMINGKRDPWSVNHLAQLAGVAALEDLVYHKQTREQLQLERNYLFTGLSKIPGVKPIPATANFLLVNIENTPLNSTQWTIRLKEKGILVRNCNTFLTLEERYLRLAVRDSRVTDRLLTVMQTILAEEGKT